MLQMNVYLQNSREEGSLVRWVVRTLMTLLFLALAGSLVAWYSQVPTYYGPRYRRLVGARRGLMEIIRGYGHNFGCWLARLCRPQP
jgi:hypothetical protein